MAISTWKPMKTVENLLEKAISKIPKQKVALLFSGGIDSLALAFYLKKLNYDFTCYTVGTKYSKDIESARKVAEELNLEHEIQIIDEKQIEKNLKKVVPILRSTSPIDVTVGLTTYLASKFAKEDIVISG